MDKPMYKLHQSCVSVKTLCNLYMVITPSWMDFLTMTIYYRQAMHWLPSPLWDNTHTTILYQNHQCRRNVLEGPFWWVIYHHLRIVLEGGYLEDHPTYIYSMDMYVQYIQCIYNYIYIYTVSIYTYTLWFILVKSQWVDPCWSHGWFVQASSSSFSFSWTAASNQGPRHGENLQP